MNSRQPSDLSGRIEDGHGACQDAGPANELEGFVYLATPQNFAGPPPENPFESLVALYIAAQDPVSGVLVKLAGEVHLDEQTGQIFSTFKNTPQVPFEDFKLEFFDGPPRVGLLASAVRKLLDGRVLHAWSGTADVPSSTSFAISSGPGGSGCAIRRPSRRASCAVQEPPGGGFTPFTVDITRHDSDQAVQGVSMRLPPASRGMLSKVERCHEPQASSERVLQRARSATRP